MTTLTAFHRTFASSSLTVAPTQNTAPVHEHRCLYTRDLHKKSKKWHDGSLRFHTFNSRVMVYDDTRNFIGDLHYRQEEDFDEGVELRLDRGVLVEVGERLGETQTDLTGILDRQRPEIGPSSRRQPVSLKTRLPSTGLSQRPKSLLEVLGPSQGRLGHARIAYPSPYEQRHIAACNEPTEPPPKRQRLSGNKENDYDEVRQSVKPARPSLPQPLRPSKHIPQPSTLNEPPIEFEELLDLSSDDEPRGGPLKPAMLSGKPTRLQKDAPQKGQLPSEYTRRKPRIPPKKNDQGGQQRVVFDKDDCGATKITRKPGSSATRTPSTTSRSSAVGTGRLLLSQPKSRRKLTCILPFPDAPSVLNRSAGVSRPSPPRKVVVQAPAVEEESYHSPPDGLRGNEDDPGMPLPLSSSESRTYERSHLDDPESSPLFMPQEDAQTQTSPSRLATMQDEFPFSDAADSDVFESLDCLVTSQRPVLDEESPIPHATGPGEGESAESAPQDKLEKPVQVEESVQPEHLGEADTENDDDHLSALDLDRPTEPECVPNGRSEVRPETKAKLYVTIEPQKGAEPGGPIETMELVQSEGQMNPMSVVWPERQLAPGNTIELQQQATSEKRNTRRVQPTLSVVPPPPKNVAEDLGTARLQVNPAIGPSTAFGARSFRRVFSENDAEEEDDALLLLKPSILKPRSPLKILENLSKKPSAKSKSPSKIQRSASDTMASDLGNAHTTRPREESPQEVIGPWTHTEAFLLFDWWPPELEKPAYWSGTTTEHIPQVVAPPAQGFLGGITTARRFLRDDVNVL